MTRPRFEVATDAPPVQGQPYYAAEDYALGFKITPEELQQCAGRGGRTSLLIGTVQLEVAIDNSRCLYVWRYSPMAGWIRSSLTAPQAPPGSLKVIVGDPLERGISIGLEEMVPISTCFDPTSGWLCVGHQLPDSGASYVEFATQTVATIVDSRLHSLWVRLNNWRELVRSANQTLW